MYIEENKDGNGKLLGINVITNINGYLHSEFFRGYTTSEEDVLECIKYFEDMFYSHRVYEHYINLPYGKNIRSFKEMSVSDN